MTPPLTGWRSLLFVPSGQARKFDRALGSDADAVIVDLEDAILEDEKAGAREWLAGATWESPTPAVVVRINGVRTPHWEDDLRAVRACAGPVAALLVPKAEPAGLDELAAATPELPPLIALVETAAGVLDARTVAAHDDVQALMLGSVDLAAQLGLELTPDGPELLRARGELVLASAAAGLRAPIDGVWSAFADDDGLRREATLARRLGFGAKACIHPRQLPIVREAFSPTDEQREWAARIVDAARAAERDGSGAVALDGEMIDRPVLLRARAILAAG